MSRSSLITRTAIGGVILAAASLCNSARAQTPPALISVTGEATISVTPDLATIDGGVTSDAKTAREAAQANNTAMGAVLLALKGAGIADKDVQTAQLSLQPQSTSRVSGGPPQIVSYRATNHVTVTLHDVGQVANTIDTLVSTGANDISGINFSVSQASKLLDDARAQAIADAQRKADIYAKAANVTLGAPLRISEGTAPGAMPMYMRASKAAASTPIAVGEETLRIVVEVSYAIKQP